MFEMWLTPLSGSQLAIRWRTEAGLRYQLEAANDGSTLFGPIGGSSFPRTGTEAVDSFTTEIGAGQPPVPIEARGVVQRTPYLWVAASGLTC